MGDLPNGISHYRNGYRVKISYVDDDGVRRRPSRSVNVGGRKGLQLAEMAKAELLATHVYGKSSPGAGADAGTVADLIGRWLTSRRPHVQPKTMDAYELAAERLLPFLGDRPADQVTAPELDDLYATLLTVGSSGGGSLSNSTVRHSYVVLSGAYSWAEKRGEISHHPVRGSTPPPKDEAPIVMPEPSTVHDLFEQIDGPVWREALFRLAVATGSRRGELLGIKWSGIDLVAGTVRRGHTVSDYSGGTQVREGSKSGKRLAPVTLDEDAMAAIRRTMNAQRAAALAAGVSLASDPWLFCKATSPSGALVMPASVAASWWRRLRAVTPALAGVQWKNLRNYVITHSLAAGVSPFEVARRAGHSDESMIMRRYVQYLPAADQAAAAAAAMAEVNRRS